MQRGCPELSIVVPTLNERANVASIVAELVGVLEGVDWEVIFVDDDSADGTAEHVRELSRANHRIRCVQRLGRRGLASACIEGMLASSAPYLAVMDGDLQHDPGILPRMLALLRTTDVEVVVGSRFVLGGAVGDWAIGRQWISRLAKRVGRALVPDDLRDPMSGFFMLRRSVLDRSVRNLSGLGFKILVDLFASSPTPPRHAEVPYSFRQRLTGTSKLDTLVAWEYLMLLADKLVGRHVPVRFLTFAFVGAAGTLVHLLVLTATFRMVHIDFIVGQAFATLAAIAFNYNMNNLLTYRDRRRRGLRWLTGLFSFTLVCGVGAVANVGVAAYVFYQDKGWLLSALTGIAVGAVWNYAVTSFYTWGETRSK